MGNSQEWEREIYFKHQNIAIMVNIDFYVFAFSSENGFAIPGKTCIWNVLPVPFGMSRNREVLWKRYSSVESRRTVLNS